MLISIETFRGMTISAGLMPVLWKVLWVLGQPGYLDLRPLGLVCEMLTWASTGTRI